MKIAIIGQDQGRLNILKNELKLLKEDQKDLTLNAVHPGLMQTVIDEKLNVLILETNQVSKIIFSLVEQIRKFNFIGPVIVVGHLANDFKMAELGHFKGLYFLKKPYEVSQLHGLVKNSFLQENMKQRKDERFKVREQATLECYRSDFKTEAIINDISRSGLSVEGNLSGLHAGDLLRLKFNFQKINKERTMSARVVWVKKDSDTLQQAGLEFVSQVTVYKYLLDYAAA